MRSILTVLGVIIGVAAVIAMLTIGQGSSRQVTSDIEVLGADILMLFPGQGFRGPGARSSAPAFDLYDIEALRDLEALGKVAPLVSTQQVAIAGNASASTSIVGTTVDYLDTGG